MKHIARTPLVDLVAGFRADTRGNFGIILSLALVPMLATFGLATNYSDANVKRSSYQNIADAAALAGATAATTDSDDLRKSRAQNWFSSQVALLNLPAAKVTVTVKNGAVKVDATATVEPKIDVAMLGKMDVQVSSTAQIAQATIRRVLDVAFCIDATGSMQNTIDSVKARAANFSTDLNNALTARGLEKFDYTRIRAIFYRDFAVDDGKTYKYRGRTYTNPLPMTSSDFMAMPSKQTDLTSFLGTQNADGGGDLPESGYECINEGLHSKWWKLEDKIPSTDHKADAIYPVIVLWSDADALPIGHADSIAADLYPTNMPRSVAGFLGNWNNPSLIDQTNRMLVHFGLCKNASWATAKSLIGYMCGGSLNDGNTNMVNKIADAMLYRYKNLTTRLTK